MAKLWVIVPAAGQGARMQTSTAKQYLPILGKTVLEHTLDKLAFLEAAGTLIVLHAQDNHFNKLPAARAPRLQTVVGGDERCDSVYNAVQQLATQADADDWVLIHDAARPCVRSQEINKLLETLEQSPQSAGAILALSISDTVKQVKEQTVQMTLDRGQLWLAQTPQVFRLKVLLKACEAAVKHGMLLTDESMAVEMLGQRILVSPGRRDNLKITTREDIELAEFILRQQLTGEICA